MVNQFRSRYIIFEFKNYARKIKQGQIYTTEKYLFLTALRSTAIIISRNGADRNAEAASRGALREHGKLMINLSISDLCKMLELKDNGDDPNTVLLDRLDDMLMRLERWTVFALRPGLSVNKLPKRSHFEWAGYLRRCNFKFYCPVYTWVHNASQETIERLAQNWTARFCSLVRKNLVAR